MSYKCPKCGGDEVKEIIYGITREIGLRILGDDLHYDVLYDKDFFDETETRYECISCGYHYKSSFITDVITEMKENDHEKL